MTIAPHPLTDRPVTVVFSSCAGRYTDGHTYQVTDMPPQSECTHSLNFFSGQLMRAVMSLQIMMDRTGDTRYEFDASDPIARARAETRFRELTGEGFVAVALNGDGKPGNVIKTFDPTAEQVLFIPRLPGG
jgi:hypothetical protein